MPSIGLYNGAVGAGATVTAGIISFSGSGVSYNPSATLTLVTYSQYSATGATTGIDTQVQYSFDGGLTYIDAVSAGMQTTPSGSTASQKANIVALSRAVTHIKVLVVNKDGANAATSCIVSYVLI